MPTDQSKICAACPTLGWPELIAAIAGPLSRHDTKESWLRRAAHKTGLTLRAVKALYYQEVTDPRHSVAVAILRAHADSQAAAVRLSALTLASRFEGLAHEILDDETASRLVDAAVALRNLDSTEET